MNSVVVVVFTVVLVPLLLNELGELGPSMARRLVRWGAGRLGPWADARRLEEEWLAELAQVPGKLTKVGHACTVMLWRAPRMRWRASIPGRPWRRWWRVRQRPATQWARSIGGPPWKMLFALRWMERQGRTGAMNEIADHVFRVQLPQGMAALSLRDMARAERRSVEVVVDPLYELERQGVIRWNEAEGYIETRAVRRRRSRFALG